MKIAKMGDFQRALCAMYLVQRELDIEESVKIGTVGRHCREVTAQSRNAKIGAIKNSIRLLLTGKAQQHATNSPGA